MRRLPGMVNAPYAVSIGIEKWEIEAHDPLESVLLQECCPAMRGRYMKRAQIHGKASIP